MRESVMNLKAQKEKIASLALGGQGQIKRASLKYSGGGGVEGDLEELQIENDRLKTSMMIMAQKLKLKEEDRAEEDEKFLSQIRQLEFQLSEKENQNQELEKSLGQKIAEMEEEFENLRNVNKGLEEKMEEMKAANSG